MAKRKIFLVSVSILVSALGLILALNFKTPTKVLPTEPHGTPPSQVSGAKDQAPATNSSQQSVEQPVQNGPRVKVTRVIDGDTIEIEGGLKIRYIGIDAPEATTSLECFGREATNKNRELVEGRQVFLEKDVSETDKFGRLLRYVYLPAGEAGINQNLINDYLVREGYSYASSYPPDVRYQDQLRQAQTDAQSNNRGLWSECKSGSYQSITGCPIKGNTSSSGEKIYHLPGQKYYDKTVIDESRGERWFCSENEAVNAGWRKSKV